jgi:hypothetical protein
MKHDAPNIIEFGSYRTPSLAPKTSSEEITPSHGIEGDPIYEAIERHKQTVAIFRAATSARARFPDFLTRMNDEQERQLGLLEEAVKAARAPCAQAGIDLIYALPTTLAGIVAVIQYILIHVRNGGEVMPHGIESDSPAHLSWIEVFLEAIADATAAVTQKGEA